MSVAELVQKCETDLRLARDYAQKHPPVKGANRPPDLMERLIELCQNGVDVVSELGDEPDAPDALIEQFIRYLKSYREFVATIVDRGDLDIACDDVRIIEFRDHTNSRIDRMTRRIESRKQFRQFRERLTSAVG